MSAYHETINILDFESLLVNLALFPLKYSWIPYFGEQLGKAGIIPAAWYLVIQLEYYFVYPIIKKLNIQKVVYLLSFVLFVLGLYRNIWYLGYNSILGAFWIFGMGESIAEGEWKITRGFFWASIILFICIGIQTPAYGSFAKDIVLGVLIGILGVSFFSKKPYSYVDSFLGKISFGIYLNHFTIKELFVNYLGHEPQGYEVIVLILVSILGAIATYYMIEQPSKYMRERFVRNTARSKMISSD